LTLRVSPEFEKYILSSSVPEKFTAARFATVNGFVGFVAGETNGRNQMPMTAAPR
jgi:hypothetical protein